MVASEYIFQQPFRGNYNQTHDKEEKMFVIQLKNITKCEDY